jgi:endonuclease/exonuclease/phosphatase family metal-dependent hydrolase
MADQGDVEGTARAPRATGDGRATGSSPGADGDSGPVVGARSSEGVWGDDSGRVVGARWSEGAWDDDSGDSAGSGDVDTGPEPDGDSGGGDSGGGSGFDDGAGPVGTTRRRHPWLRLVRTAVAWGVVVVLAVWLAVRLTGVGRGTVAETVLAFTPYAAMASVVATPLLVALRARRAAAVSAACCAGFAFVMAPLFVAGPRPPIPPDGPSLRVMTVNVHFGTADAAAVVRLVEAHDVDVLGVQELTPGFHTRLVAAGIDDLLPNSVVDAREGAAGTGLYSRLEADRRHRDVPGGRENPTARLDVAGAPPVELTVVHPLPPVFGTWRNDWQRTLDALPRPEVSRQVTLLVGDFNATVDQPSMQTLLDDGYVDAAGAVGQGWVPTWRSRLGPVLVIDHVLVDRMVGVDAVSVHDVPGTDHRALVADLHLPSD